jgi:hypothetical protein
MALESSLTEISSAVFFESLVLARNPSLPQIRLLQDAQRPH